MTETEWLDIFGDNLVDMISNAGMTQRDFADETGLSEATVSNYINKRRMPTIKAIINIAYALNCSVDELTDFGSPIR